MSIRSAPTDDAQLGDIMRYGPDAGDEPADNVLYGPFTIEGVDFVAMDSAADHRFAFNEAVSCHDPRRR